MVLSIPLAFLAPDVGPFFILAGPLGVACANLGWAISPWVKPASVQFGNLRTFRDLAIALTSKKAAVSDL